VLGNDAPQLGFWGRRTITAGQKQVNRETLTAFRNALATTYGAFGEKAFDGILGSRLAFGKSLRVRDITAVTSLAPKLVKKALENEIVRQLQSSPQYLRLHAENHPQTVAKAIVEYAYAHSLIAGNLYPTDADGQRDFRAFLRNTQGCIQSGASKVIDAVLAEHGGNLPDVDQRDAAAEEDKLKKGLDYDITSVEDQVRKGEISPGMRLGNGKNPMVFVSLKEKGVEPGFIARYDWSHSDTANMLLDVLDESVCQVVAGRLLERPGSRAAHHLSTQSWYRPGMDKAELAAQLAAHPDAYLQIGLYLGRTANDEVPGSTAFAAIHVLKRDLCAPGNNAVKDAFRRHFPDRPPQEFADSLMNPAHPASYEDRAFLQEVMARLFQPIRDGIMRHYQETDPESGLSAFAHYAEQHIVKLDYNESQDTLTGSHRTSERTKLKQGTLYHYFRTTTSKESNIGAVSEVLANDLMAKTGIPSQELVLRHAGWSDGKSKLLLEGTMAKGYRDLDKFLKDGRLVNEDGKRLQLQELGKYKIMLLLFGDRDGVGSHAQNKGCIGNQFFAIDPGHSLEGKKLTFSTDFSFTANSDFKNYSIFDDTPRAEKFRGVLEIRKNLVKSLVPNVVLRTHVSRNFEQYREVARKQDKDTCTEMLRRIDEMEREFTNRIKDICDTFQSQLALYDALAGDGTDPERVRDAEAAIEAEATLEKLASPSTCKSRNGQVQLRHMEVAPKDRKPATIQRNPDGGYTISLRNVKQAESQKFVNNLTHILAEDFKHALLASQIMTQTQYDPRTETVSLQLNAAEFNEFIHALKEEDVYKLKHPADFPTRP
jgi:hypothetical protein